MAAEVLEGVSVTTVTAVGVLGIKRTLAGEADCNATSRAYLTVTGKEGQENIVVRY